jgi:hypothetical protein
MVTFHIHLINLVHWLYLWCGNRSKCKRTLSRAMGHWRTAKNLCRASHDPSACQSRLLCVHPSEVGQIPPPTGLIPLASPIIPPPAHVPPPSNPPLLLPSAVAVAPLSQLFLPRFRRCVAAAPSPSLFSLPHRVGTPPRHTSPPPPTWTPGHGGRWSKSSGSMAAPLPHTPLAPPPSSSSSPPPSRSVTTRPGKYRTIA